MEVKVEQWVRSGKDIKEVLLVEQDEKRVTVLDDVWRYWYMERGKNFAGYLQFIEKVADTPQELIRVGDLVWHKHIASNPTLIKDKEELEWLLESFKIITKIYTPNEDKSVYTLQWEADNK